MRRGPAFSNIRIFASFECFSSVRLVRRIGCHAFGTAIGSIDIVAGMTGVVGFVWWAGVFGRIQKGFDIVNESGFFGLLGSFFRMEFTIDGRNRTNLAGVFVFLGVFKRVWQDGAMFVNVVGRLGGTDLRVRDVVERLSFLLRRGDECRGGRGCGFVRVGRLMQSSVVMPQLQEANVVEWQPPAELGCSVVLSPSNQAKEGQRGGRYK